jgi:hypothetical protein
MQCVLPWTEWIRASYALAAGCALADLKPENVMLAEPVQPRGHNPDDEKPEVRVGCSRNSVWKVASSYVVDSSYIIW